MTNCQSVRFACKVYPVTLSKLCNQLVLWDVDVLYYQWCKDIIKNSNLSGVKKLIMDIALYEHRQNGCINTKNTSIDSNDSNDSDDDNFDFENLMYKFSQNFQGIKNLEIKG